MRRLKLHLNRSIRRFILLTFVAGILLSVVRVANSTSQTAQSAPIRIMPLGNSITQPDGFHNSYRRPLWLKLRSSGYNVDFVGSTREHYQGKSAPLSDFDQDHEGHSGWRADQILEQIDNWARASQPDIVLVHLGTNDLLQGQTPQSTIEELRTLIQKLRAINPSVKMLLAQPIPCGDRTRVQQLNSLIPNLARATTTQKSPVMTVDQFSGFNPAKGEDTYDGCHPNESGEQKMANRWFAALTKVLATP